MNIADVTSISLPNHLDVVVSQPNHFLTGGSDLQGKEVRIIFEVETGKVHCMAEIRHLKQSSIQLAIPMTENNIRVAENVVGDWMEDW